MRGWRGRPDQVVGVKLTGSKSGHTVKSAANCAVCGQASGDLTATLCEDRTARLSAYAYGNKTRKTSDREGW